ncbi:hypothetical protein GCM10012275_24020 [Longimycelium tulufanense]|uniref:Uncharacterized protein n=1 Tax=Longimycelium tulufanense TaxID=907463 RepID=A0A8J3C844_9PSEU|nr:hypothetical protein [Longimycelium tulufanense]GGM52256.1 hypothetical protein GCM10012275_24020 [Longimycelium tulufanense]
MRSGWLVLLVGLVAGAAGTMVLDITGYLDMVVSGRAASQTPAAVADTLARVLGVDLGDPAAVPGRRAAVGALLGYLTGLAVGAGYALARLRVRRLSLLPATLAVFVVVMLASNGPMVVFGLTNQIGWGWRDWISDLIPHLGYAVVTAVVFEVLYRVVQQLPEWATTAGHHDEPAATNSTGA